MTTSIARSISKGGRANVAVARLGALGIVSGDLAAAAALAERAVAADRQYLNPGSTELAAASATLQAINDRVAASRR